MRKYDLPIWVSKYKEKGKTIKVRNSNYYLYESKCIYDKNRKNKHYTKDIYLGRITEDDGFLPAKKNNNFKPEDLYSKVYGSYLLFDNLGSNILNRLIKYFGDNIGKMIYTIAVLRAIENTPYSELEDAYEENYLSVKYNNLSMSKSSLSDFLKKLSKYKTNMNNFMKEDIEEDDILIFDGTNILCGGTNITYKGFGYKHGHNYNTQVNELYAYSVRNRKPIYYKLLEGSISDKATLTDVLKEAGIKNSISLIDKGFNSESNINSLLENKNKYIMALRNDSKLVSKEILSDFTRNNCKEMFTLLEEAIFAYEVKDGKDRICIYFNSTISSVMDAEYIDKMSRNVKGFEKEKYQEKKQRFGIYIIRTNIENLNLETIYKYYKSRFEIEYMFDTMKNTLGFDKSYMHSDESIESWAFVNHISIILTQKVYDLLRKKDVKIPLHHLYKKLRQVKVIKNNLEKTEKYELQGIPKKTRDLLSKLEIIS